MESTLSLFECDHDEMQVAGGHRAVTQRGRKTAFPVRPVGVQFLALPLGGCVNWTDLSISAFLSFYAGCL